MGKKKRKIIIFIFWFMLVVLWNFGVPGALPIFDVLVAVILSIVSIYLNKLFQ